VKEPTLPALALTIIGIIVLAGTCVAGIAFLPAFGYIWWTFAAVAAVLVCLVLSFRGRTQPDSESLTGRQRWFHRLLILARLVFIGLLACWLGLIVWLALCPSGPDPAPKTDPNFIRIITWNIHCGQDQGLPWKRFDWPHRKHALRAALEQAQPDILCVQEATPEQVSFLEEVLPGRRRVGVGRDGESAGEHCAIYFNRSRFAELGGNTFWLEEPTDQPGASSALDAKRICTWVRLRDRTNGRTLRVYNAHLYLWEAPSLKAAEMIVAHIKDGDRADAVLLTADFNASPSAPSRKVFTRRETGLVDSAERAGKPSGKPTFHLYGIGLWCIDGILVDSNCTVNDHRILNVKPNNIFPSDHFGLMADLSLRE
jgi:endonuclease/exonuclease/phosphatase family metal-dependent hydrolase